MREEAADLSHQNWQLQATIGQLKAQLAEARAGSGLPAGADSTRLLELACNPKDPSPAQCLDAIEAAHGDTVFVLQSARNAAQAIPNFENGRRLLDLLRRLTEDYLPTYLEGGDARARGVFTRNEYSACESEAVMNNNGLRQYRTFDYDGQPTEMFQHLKVGIAANTSKTVRVHFYVDAPRRRVVIGYCGEHLPISSR